MEQENINKGNYLVYAIMFVVILILTGILISYAFFKADTISNSTTTNVTASADCIDITYSETNTIVGLDYNYPITDSYALQNITPVTVTLTNNCNNNVSSIPYKLIVTSLSDSTGYIPDSKIRINVKRSLNGGSDTELISSKYLSNVSTLTSGNAYDNLMTDLNNRSNVSSYTNKTSYVLDSSTINATKNSVNTYKVYLWVDYYEGDSQAYNGATHDSSYDNSTQGLNFKSAISLVVNAQ